MSATSLRRTGAHAITRPTVSRLAALVTYATSLAGVYLSVGFLFYFAAKEKLITNGAVMPTGLRKEFAGSLFASVPGDNLSWALLGVIEASIVVLLAISLVRGEFLTTRRKPFLLAGLGVAMLALGVMGLANDMVGDNATVLELFTYLGLIAVLMFMIHQLPPYRSVGWISGTNED
jgi:hypothetical protein